MADDCAAGAGAALPYLSTEQTVQDMDAIRAALGERQTNFLGVSYGTYLGAAYTARFPHRTGRMVLDSVVGEWDWYDFDVIQSRVLLRQRDTFFAWTAAHPDRFGLGGSAETVRRAYLRVRQGLTARPVAGFGPAEFDRAVYRALGRTERWAGLADGLRTYLRDGSPDALRPAAAFDGPDSRNYEAANRIVKCADAPAPDPAPDPGGHPPHPAPRPAASPDRHGGVHLRLLAPPPLPPHPARQPRRPARPAGGLRPRPRHPHRGRTKLRRLLPGSRLVTLDNDYSHGVFASRGNACVDETAAAYLVEGRCRRWTWGAWGPGLPDVP